MADLRGKQLKDGFQNLVTIGATTTSDPTTGALTNGKDTAITQVTLGLGSASAPSYSFTGDTDTGMFSSGANALNLVTGSNTRMTISNIGNVSIGTASSSAKLQVGTSNEEILRLERDTTSNDSFIDLTYASGHSDDSDANHEYSKIRTKVVANLENSESSELHFQTINSGTIGNKMVITNDGKVGIGTDSPSTELHVKGSGEILRIDEASATGSPFMTFFQNGTRRSLIQHLDSGDLLSLVSEYGGIRMMTGTSGTEVERMRIDSSGNVGIGTQTSSHPLTVRGASTLDTVVTYAKFEGGPTSQPSLSIGGNNTTTVGDRYAWIQAEQSDGTPTTHLVLNKDGGNVGIGTDSPSTKLEIKESSNGAGDAVIRLRGHGNNADNTVLGALEWFNTDSSGDSPSVVARIEGLSGNANGHMGELAFKTHDGSEGGEGSTAVERMRIDSSGNVGIGTDSPPSISSTARWLTLNADSGSSASGGIIHQVDGTTKGALFVFGSNVFHDAKSGIGHIFSVNNGTEAMRINTSANVGIGTTSPENRLHIAGTNTVAMTLQAPTHDSGVASTATMNFKYQSSGGSAIGKIELVERGTNSFNGKFVFGLPVSDSGQSTRDIMTIDFNGDILPAIDSLSDIGSSSNRFVDIHADNGTIQTSDRNQKQDFEQITEAEVKVAQKAKGLLTKYKWIKDVQKYGDDAQYHIGIIAQELITAFEEEGLNYKKYAMIYESEHLEDSGEMTTYYGVRYTELLAFIISTL